MKLHSGTIYLPEARCTLKLSSHAWYHWDSGHAHGLDNNQAIHMQQWSGSSIKQLLKTTKFNIWRENHILAFKLHETFDHRYNTNISIFTKAFHTSQHNVSLHHTSSIFYHYSIISFFHMNLVEWLLSHKTKKQFYISWFRPDQKAFLRTSAFYVIKLLQTNTMLNFENIKVSNC